MTDTLWILALLAMSGLVCLPSLLKDHEACRPLCPLCNKELATVEMGEYSLCVKCYNEKMKS